MEKTKAKTQIKTGVKTPSWVKMAVRNRALYLFLLPAVLYMAIFNYAPMFGIQIAFRDFTPAKGVWGSPWVGFEYFEKFFTSYSFWTLLKNTLTLSIYQLLVCFPFPIILALILNYCPSVNFKKITQTITYIPHFLSVVVLVGMLFIFFSPGTGIVNNLIRSLGGSPIDFLGNPDLFPHMFVWSAAWQNTGWASIIYVSALSGVSQEIHEAAIVDGAGKLQRIWNIDIPAILPTIITLLILNSGQIMSVGYEKVYLMQSAGNLSTSEIISTHVYKIGIQGAQYSYAAAIGLFNNVINMAIILVVNKLSDKLTGAGLW